MCCTYYSIGTIANSLYKVIFLVYSKQTSYIFELLSFITVRKYMITCTYELILVFYSRSDRSINRLDLLLLLPLLFHHLLLHYLVFQLLCTLGTGLILVGVKSARRSEISGWIIVILAIIFRDLGVFSAYLTSTLSILLIFKLFIVLPLLISGFLSVLLHSLVILNLIHLIF